MALPVLIRNQNHASENVDASSDFIEMKMVTAWLVGIVVSIIILMFDPKIFRFTLQIFISSFSIFIEKTAKYTTSTSAPGKYKILSIDL